MTELKTQSAQIKDTNKSVTDSMSKLQQKTKEVENIADMILNISSQTNLLALNASIESARAGEAGRGFAVVAEQIRQLAEQTKGFTEDITKIIYELNANADDVVESVRFLSMRPIRRAIILIQLHRRLNSLIVICQH